MTLQMGNSTPAMHTAVSGSHWGGEERGGERRGGEGRGGEGKTSKAKQREDYTCWRKYIEKPSIVQGCPGVTVDLAFHTCLVWQLRLLNPRLPNLQAKLRGKMSCSFCMAKTEIAS